MAMSRHVRLTLRVASLTCLLLALFPYYSHTAGPPAFPATIELPQIGTLPAQPSKTVFRLGLPFSPLLTYQKEITFEPKPTSKVEPGGDVTVQFSGAIGHTQYWRFGFFSWSATLAILGVGLLIVSFWNQASRTRTPSDITSGPNA